MKPKYDIFISYRRRDAGEKAEHLKDLLEPHYKGRISFDRENLTGVFDVALVNRIDRCRDFLLVLGQQSLVYKKEHDDQGADLEDTGDYAPEVVALYRHLGTCTQEEFAQKIREMGPNAPIDFVRIEIARALARPGLHIIPVVPESTERFSFSRLCLPPDIAEIQRREAVFYSDNPDALFKDVVPKIQTHMQSRPDVPLMRVLRWLVAVLLLMGLAIGAYLYHQHRVNGARKLLMTETVLDGQFYPVWDQTASVEQLQAVTEMLANMVPVEGGSYQMGAAPEVGGEYADEVDVELETPQLSQEVKSFWMSKYEVSVGEWHRVMGGDYAKADASLPMSRISFDDCQAFVQRLHDLTGLNFALPTEVEWEYAARGGQMPDSTRFAGSNTPDEVAWYTRNSGGRAHVRNDVDGGLYCNALDLFDMSGNVSEWSDTDFRTYRDLASENPNPEIIDPEAKVIRGGNYASDKYELTVTHREPMNAHEASAVVGVRIIIRND